MLARDQAVGAADVDGFADPLLVKVSSIPTAMSQK
jgi:hypothetical protein